MRTIIFIAVLLVPVSASAEALLMELHHYNDSGDNSCGGQPGDNTTGCASLFFGAESRDGLGISARFAEQLNGTHLGIERALNDPVELAAFNYTLKLPDSAVRVSTAPRTGVIGVVLFTPDQLWDDGITFGQFSIIRYVPRLGIGLSGYQLTNITHTLDMFSVVNRTAVKAGQVIRIYGEQVPEPAAWLLLTMGAWACVHCFHRKRFAWSMRK